MKNRRTITVSVIGVGLAAVALAAIVHWYRAGELPAGPTSFFQPRDLQRAQARLAAHRLDLQPAINLCHEIELHLQRASTIRFTNPETATGTLRSLANEIDRIALSYQDTLARMEDGHPGAWEAPFAEFLSTSRAGYIEAVRLCGMLSRQDWSAIGFPALQKQIVEAKGITSNLQMTHLFPEAVELRATLYPLFEQAYGDRNESDLTRIRRRLLRPQPAMTRWFYARLYQSRHTLPVDLCAERLYASRDELNTLSEELDAADVQGVLARWTFPRGRATHLEQVAHFSAPLADAESIRDWLRMVSADRDAWQQLLHATAPDADAPDAELRAIAQWIILTMDILDKRVTGLIDFPTLLGSQLFATTLEESTRSHRELLDCPATALGRARIIQTAMYEAYDQLRALPIDDSTPVLEAATRFRNQATAFAESLGAPISDELTLDGMDHWFVRQWPEVRTLDRLAAGMRALQRQGIVTFPRLPEIAILLEDMAGSQTDAERQDLVTRWNNGLSEGAAAIPLTSRQIEKGLESLELVTLREDLRDAIRLNEDNRIRTIAERVLAGEGMGSDLREAARACITILDLPQRLHELNLDNPDHDHPIFPIAPGPESMVYPMYVDRVAPILNVARNIKQLSAGDCIDTLTQVASDLNRIWELYPHWDALDPLVEHAVLQALPHCIVIEEAALEALAKAFNQLSSRLPEFAKLSEKLARLGDLLQLDPTSEEFRIHLVGIEDPHFWPSSFQGLSGERLPNVTAYLRTGHAVVNFHSQTAAVTSFHRLRREGSILRDAPICPALAGYVSGLLQHYTEDMDHLFPVVRMDIGMIRATDAAPSPHLLDLSERYAQAAGNPGLFPALQQYAGSQASALRHYVVTNAYTITPFPGEKISKQKPHILYSALAPDFAGLGYGLRSKGKGTGLVVSLRTADQTVPLLTADWKDFPDHGYIELKDVELTSATFIWQWGYPVEIGMTVAHTQYDNRDLVPDDGDDRSRWNPLNYAVYRVETNHYPIATFPNLEALARDVIYADIRSDGTAVIRLDPLLNPERTAEMPTTLIFTLDGLPVGRDMDWPQFLPPPNAADARALGRDIRNAASNLFEEVLSTP